MWLGVQQFILEKLERLVATLSPPPYTRMHCTHKLHTCGEKNNGDFTKLLPCGSNSLCYGSSWSGAAELHMLQSAAPKINTRCCTAFLSHTHTTLCGHWFHHCTSCLASRSCGGILNRQTRLKVRLHWVHTQVKTLAADLVLFFDSFCF